MDKKYCNDSGHTKAESCVADMVRTEVFRDVLSHTELTDKSIEASKKVLSKPTSEIINGYSCSLKALKILMIRLRRAMPIGQITYASGIDKYIKDDWIAFKNIYETDIDYYQKIINDRWLVAILDTYSDHGSDNEKKNALIATSYIRYEIISGTEIYAIRNSLINRSEFNESKIIKNTQTEIWSSILTTQLPEDDFYCNFFRRTITLLQDTPHIAKAYCRFLQHSIESKNSLLHTICKASPWIHQNILDSIKKCHQK